jgi:hypothetical protein
VTVTTSADHHGGLERVRFFPRQLLSHDDLRLDQAYHRERLRRHNRHLHGWGVVAGCDVRPAPEAGKPWQVRVCPGYLLTPQGDEVLIAGEIDFDIATCALRSSDPCAFARPCPPVSRRAIKDRTLYLAVRYDECHAHPVRVPPGGCGCDDVQCEYARTRDGYELCCLGAPPKTHRPPDLDCDELDHGTILPFRPCPTDPWVVLARITLPRSSSQPLALQDVDPLSHRRLLYPTAALQELARCAYAGGPLPMPTPTPTPP